MTQSRMTPGIVPGRLTAEEIAANFADLHPPLTAHEALVAADRCYFCHDAPCVTACPTTIDIPMFIRQIAAGNPKGAAKTIFDQNILGGMCARVCPTETLCEEACVRMTAEETPVEIGRLQRYATDIQMATGAHPYTRAPWSGFSVAIVGAGPAGLACAHRLAMRGHDAVIYDARPQGGGLNEYGIAAYKTVNDFAQNEIDWLRAIGGITLKTGERLGEDFTLAELAESHDAVFLAVGLAGVNALRAEGEGLAGVSDAVDFIADLRQAEDMTKLPVGRNVVVIGGGMTAIDAAVQSRLLGAENVTIAYRRGKDAMSASEYEQDLAASRGVTIRHSVRPVKVIGEHAATAVEFEYTRPGPKGLEGTGETFTLPADQVLKAIGQTLDKGPLAGLEFDGAKIWVDEHGRTTLPKVWAGGDCARGGDDLTVTAVAEGRDAAEDIHRSLMGG
jgi:glutamate synthase (NADPH/NADH) small chain